MFALHFAFAATACGERVRDRRGKRCHQDRKQSQPTADLLMKTTQDAPDDTIGSCRGLCHGPPPILPGKAPVMPEISPNRRGQ